MKKVNVRISTLAQYLESTTFWKRCHGHGEEVGEMGGFRETSLRECFSWDTPRLRHGPLPPQSPAFNIQ